jgi:hypothetical protein
MKSIYKIETMTPDDIKNINIIKQTVSTIEEMFTIIKRRPDLHNTIYEKQFYDPSVLSKIDSQELREYINLISSKPVKKFGLEL